MKAALSMQKAVLEESNLNQACQNPKVNGGRSILKNEEIKLLQENLETQSNRLRSKQQLLEKARSLNNFKQCDDISGEIVQLRRERAVTESQLSALQKRESKSAWYHSEKKKKSVIKVKKEPKATTQSPTLERFSSSASTTSTASTVILSDNDEDTSNSDRVIGKDLDNDDERKSMDNVAKSDKGNKGEDF